MSGYGMQESRINYARHAQVNQCGACGTEISATELLCKECRRDVNQQSQQAEDNNG
jgi:hypothetical protein